VSAKLIALEDRHFINSSSFKITTYVPVGKVNYTALTHSAHSTQTTKVVASVKPFARTNLSTSLNSYLVNSSDFGIVLFETIGKLSASKETHASNSSKFQVVLAELIEYNRTNLSLSIDTHSAKSSFFTTAIRKPVSKLDLSEQRCKLNSSRFLLVLPPPAYPEVSRLNLSVESYLLRSSYFYSALPPVQPSNVDLVVANINYTPANPVDGDEVTVVATVENRGAASTNKSFYVSFYIDEELIGEVNVPVLNPNESVVVTQSWIATPGNHTISVVVDRYDFVGETNESNNFMAKNMSEIGFPDLIISSLTWTPVDITVGDHVNFIAKVENVGSDTHRKFIVALYVSGRLMGEQYLEGLASGKSEEVNYSWVATPGTPSVEVRADPSNIVVESNELNNNMSKTIYGIKQADIVITNLAWTPTDIKDGTEVTFNATIKNVGDGNASKFYVEFYVDDNSIGGKWIDGIFSGDTITITKTWVATPGSHTVKVFADSGDLVPEIDETNNVLSEPLAEIGLADIVVTDLTWTPANIEDGDIVTFTTTIKNTGDDTVRDFYIRLYVNGEAINQTKISGLLSGGVITVQAQHRLKPGHKNVSVIADIYNTVVEQNEENNIITKTLYVEYSDLIISDVSWSPTSPVEGDVINFKVNVTNIGGGTLREFHVKLFIDDYEVSDTIVNGLGSNATVTSLNAWEAVAGKHSVKVLVDYLDNILESNETNNEFLDLLYVGTRPPGNVLVYVHDVDGPIENTLVTLSREGMYNVTVGSTNSSGKVFFANLSVGNYIVQASARGYVYNSTTISVGSGETSEVELVLVPKGGVTGTVRDSVTNIPLAGAEVVLSNGLTVSTLTDENGKYCFTDVTPGVYTLTVSKEGYITDTATVNVKAGENSSVDILLEPFGAIAGRVVNLTGCGVHNAEVILNRDDALCTKLTNTSSDGSFLFTNVVPGRYTLQVLAEGYESKTVSVKVESGRTSHLNISLAMMPVVAGKVISNTGFPISGALVTIYGKDRVVGAGYTNSDGSYRVVLRDWGYFIVKASACGYIENTTIVSAHLNEVITLDLILTQFGFVNGTVEDAISGLPIANATVYIGKFSTLTDENGRYSLYLMPGEYTAKALARGYVLDSSRVEIVSGETTYVNFSLIPGGRITGVVRDALSGQPIKGALVELLQNGAVKLITETNSTGGYLLEEIKPGNYTLKVIARGYNPSSSALSVRPYETTNVDFILIPSEVHLSIDIPGETFSRGETVVFNLTVTNPAGQVLPGSNISSIGLFLEGPSGENESISLRRVGDVFTGNYTISPNATIGEWVAKAYVVDIYGNRAEDVVFIHFAEAFYIQLETDRHAYVQKDKATFHVKVSRYSNLTRLLIAKEINVSLRILDKYNNTVLTLPLTAEDGVFTASICLTNLSIGDYIALVEVKDGLGNVMEVAKPFRIVEDFVITVNVDKRTYNRTEPVRIYGEVFYANGQNVSEADVRITIYTKGFARTFYVKTNMSGLYEYTFIPSATEAGIYKVEVSSSLNGIERCASTKFVILGLLVQNVIVKMAKNSTNDIYVNIANIGEIELSGVTAVIENGSQNGVTATIIEQPNSFIPSGGTTRAKIRISAGIDAKSNTEFTVIVTCDQGAVERGVITVNLYPAKPIALVTPTLVDVSLNPGKIFTQKINITNIGFDVMRDVRIVKPRNEWISITFTDIVNLNPGESKIFDVIIHPTEDVDLGIYQDEIKIVSSNHQPVSIYIVVKLSSAHVGNLLLHVTNDVGENVSEALVTLQNQDVGTVYSSTTNSSGYCLFKDVPTGRYSYIVSAEGHNTVCGVTTIEPEVIKEVNEILPVKIMDVKLTVEPIKIKDHYLVVLNLTFETDVPPPVLLPVPSYIEHAVNRTKVFEDGYQAEGWITIYNSGLVSVFNVTIDSSEINTDDYSLTFENGQSKIVISEVKAKSSVDIPYIFKIRRGAKGIESRLLGKIKIEGEYIYFERNSDKTHRAHTKAEIPVFVREIGVRKLVVDPSIIFIVKNDYSLSFISPSPSELPQINITNVGEEYATIFKFALGAGVKLNIICLLKVLAEAVSMGCPVEPVGCAIAVPDLLSCGDLYIFEGFISKNNLIEFNPNVFRFDLLKPRSMIEELFIYEFISHYEEYWNNPLSAIVVTLYTNETAYLRSSGFSLSEFASIISSVVPSPSILIGGEVFVYAWQFSESPDFYIIPIIVIDLNIPMVTIPGGMGGGGAGGGGGGGWGGGYLGGAITYDYTPPTITYPTKPVVYKIEYEPIDYVHERVKLSISQDVTLERDAFYACLEMKNKLENKTIESVNVNLKVFDSEGNDVTSNFFIKIERLDGIESVEGGSIPPLETAKIHWTIIPEPETGGTSEDGRYYFVQAFINYTVDGNNFSINSTQARILVKPQPSLILDYYIPSEVKANKPFKLAVKVTNEGYGTASNFAIESAQPEIYENIAGLLVDFKIIGSAVAGQKAGNSLKVNFGDIAPGESKLAWWEMVTTLDGEFTGFSATYTHDDALGRARTSLIKDVRTHIITKEIAVDSITYAFLVDSDQNGIPDGIVDMVYGNTESVTPANYSILSEPTPDDPTLVVKTEKDSGWIYLSIDDPYNNTRKIKRIIRSDGKILDTHNYWISNGKIYIVDDASETYSIIYEYDTTPPASITNLSAVDRGTTWILWNWTNPSDEDFNHVEVWINGVWKANVSYRWHSYNATGLQPNTTYEIGIRTVDDVGNVNSTWVNDTATTLPELVSPIPTASKMNVSPNPIRIPIGGRNTSTIKINLSSDDGIGELHTITVAFYNATTKKLTTKLNGSLAGDVSLDAEYGDGIIYYYWTPGTAGTYEFTLTLWFESGPITINERFIVLVSDDYVEGDEIIAVASGELFAYPIEEVLTVVLVSAGLLLVGRRLLT